MRSLTSKISVLLVVGSVLTLIFFHQTYDFSDKTPGPDVLLTIPDGATGVAIGKLLENTGTIKSGKFFIDYYLANPSAHGIAPGIHRIERHISTKLAVKQLLDQTRIESAINVKEGSTLSDVLNVLKSNKSILFTKLNEKGLELPISNKYNSLEGQLSPAIYSFEPGTKTDVAIQTMLNRFSGTTLKNSLQKYGSFSAYEVLKVASIIQVEGDLKDFNKVARVVYNRLAINMPLQLNSTVQYATGQRGRIALSTKATNILSPYNTYRNQGLPPTPISNPSTAAIIAASHPSVGDWLYFITVKPGDTRFTSDFKVFEQWNKIYNNNLANGLFK